MLYLLSFLEIIVFRKKKHSFYLNACKPALCVNRIRSLVVLKLFFSCSVVVL